MCWSDQGGCTQLNALNATRPVSVPFVDNPTEGYMRVGPNGDPIFHDVDYDNYTITNYALEGHPYAGGKVVHSLTVDKGLSFSWSRGFYMREGIYLTTVGTGPNSSWCCGLDSAAGNYVAGHALFTRTHYMAPRLMQQYLE